jgi:hypothetical protein
VVGVGDYRRKRLFANPLKAKKEEEENTKRRKKRLK